MLNKQKMLQNKILPSLSALALLNTAAFSGIVAGQSQATVEEIVVTARKKAESLQDVPVSVSALSEETLEEKGVNVFEDYLLQLPGVTAGGSGPGNNTIYIRGLASTTPAMTTAGVAGLAPNVSFYLDEQPLAQPGRNLDVYAADIGRVEVLSGPQGTLFGASSQSGVVRMITNKPIIGETASSLEVEGRYMREGDMGNKFEYVSNIPLTDSSALRFVAYRDKRGGYIDQVAGTRSVKESARFRTADTVRANGLVVGSSRAGFQAGANLSAAQFLDADAIVKEDSNPVTYEGFRASLATQINDDWDALVSVASQDIESEGVFFVDPELGSGYEIQRYTDDTNNDSFDNMSLTLEGTVGDLEVIYAGAYTDRATDQNIDYTDYLFVGQYVPFYICDGVTNYTSTASAGTCQAPDMYVAHTGSTEVTTHELRINTDINDTTSITAGVFLSDLEMIEHNEFTYPGSAKLQAQYAPNFPHTNPQAGQGGNAGAGWYSQPGPYYAPIIFVNDILRTDEQKGVFGEANIALSDTMELTLGARWYDIAVDLEGSANGAYGNKGATSDSGGGGANLSVQYGPNNTNGYPDKAETDGVIGKATLSWKPTDDIMYFLTWSEGFRPGLLNRPAGTSNGAGYTIPAVTDTDEVTNFEFGWKASLMDGALRFNGSAFMVDISGLQSTIFDASIVNLFFSDNAADAEILGAEGDFVYITENGLMLSGAFSVLDTELTSSLVPTSDIVVGKELAFAPGYQANLAARKEWGMTSGNTGHWQAQVTVSDDSFSDIMEPNRAQQSGYTLMNVRTGVSNDDWTAEVYIDNLTNRRAEISNTFIFDRERIGVVKPRTLGVRYKRNF
jgi:outer membrane receptor protein involved in Fe transport|tara:strand:- start:2898 stop:5435 length:2538 start_codon:yes stop_codon:yes gene_type:complete